MNLLSLLFIPLYEDLHIVAKEYDKTKVCSTYLPKMDLNTENPKMSKSKLQFNEIWMSVQ